MLVIADGFAAPSEYRQLNADDFTHDLGNNAIYSKSFENKNIWIWKYILEL